MTNNLDIWHKLERTDPEHVKPFQRTGGFRGTAIKPMYAVKKMTEVFGPCGKGWGADEPKFTVVGDAVFCTVSLWMEDPNDPCRVYGIGGDLIVKRPRSGEPYHDDEAFKKAYTDALTNAMKHLGTSADVHMGLFDDSKYVAELRREKQQEPEKTPSRTKPAPPPEPETQGPPWPIFDTYSNGLECETAEHWIDTFNMHLNDVKSGAVLRVLLTANLGTKAALERACRDDDDLTDQLVKLSDRVSELQKQFKRRAA